MMAIANGYSILPLTEPAGNSRYTCILRDKSITNGDINDQISSLLSALMKPYGVLEMSFDERNAHLAIGLFARYVLDQIGEPRKTHK